MTQLYEENFGNALGTALGNGVQVFQQRQDQLDEKNYTRSQTKTLTDKQDAALLYNHLDKMAKDFRDMQGKGGQQKMSSLELAQSADSLNKVNKMMGLLTSGKYADAQQAYGEFQNHMDAVAGPGPTDSTGAAVSGPPAPVAGTGTYSSADILNNQTGAGNQLLGSLAYKTTDAQATQAVNAAGLGTAELSKVQQTLASTIKVMNSDAEVGLKKNDIYMKLSTLAQGADKATYLSGIAKLGAAGIEIIKNLDPDIVPQAMKDAAIRTATNVQTVDDAGATSATLRNQIDTFNLTDIQAKAPLVYRGMELANQLSSGSLLQQGADLKKAGVELEAAQQQLDQNRELFPDQHDLLRAQLGTAQAQLAITQATQDGTIAATDASNWGSIAKLGKDPAFFDQLLRDGKITPAQAAMYKGLATYTKQYEDAALSLAQSNATKGGSDARTAVATEGFTVANARNAASLSGSQASAAATDLQFRARSGALSVQGQRLDNQGKANANFSSGVANKYAEGMAKAGLTTAQGQAQVSQAQGGVAGGMADAGLQSARGAAVQQAAAGQVAAATVGTEVAGAKAKLQGALLDNTGKALTNDLVRATFGAQVKKYGLDNELTSSNIASNYFQISRMKALLPGEIAAQAAALDYSKAQATKMLRDASDKGDRAEQIKILQQQRIISDKDVTDAQLGISRLIPNAKFGVDQFDPSNYSTMTAKLDENQKKQLVDAITNYNAVMSDRKQLNQNLTDLRTGNSSLPGGVTTTGTGGNRAMTAPPGFKSLSDSAAKKAGVNPAAFYGFLGAESSFGTNTSNYAGMDYVGAGQVGQAAQDDVNKNFGTNLDRNVPAQNMELAARYYKLISTRLKTQDPMVIYAAYNWGAGNVQKHLAANGGRLTLSGLPAETQTGLGNMSAALRGYGGDTGGGTPQKVVDTTSTPPPPPVPTKLQPGDFRSSGGGVYSSPTLQITQWQNLDKTGFFKAVQKMNPNDGAGVGTLLKKYSLQLFGGDWENHMGDLAQVAKQVIGK